MDFSAIVKTALKEKKITLTDFAKRMELSFQYTYKLVNKKEDKRWNEDSMKKACEILGLEIQFVSKSA